jgi:hypothetical protein
MPYRVAFDGPTVVITFFGTLMPADLERVVDDILGIEDGGRNTPPRLIDLRGITSAAVGYPEMAQLAERAIARPLSGPVRTAIVVEQPVQLGFARMFQILNQHPQVTVQIFDDEPEARAWLAGRESDPVPNEGSHA